MATIKVKRVPTEVKLTMSIDEAKYLLAWINDRTRATEGRGPVTTALHEALKD